MGGLLVWKVWEVALCAWVTGDSGKLMSAVDSHDLALLLVLDCWCRLSTSMPCTTRAQ